MPRSPGATYPGQKGGADRWSKPTTSGKSHLVPLNQDAMDVLEKRKGDHLTHVFTYEGNPIVQVNTKAFRNALQRAGILDFRWHDLRHTFATWHREAGTPTHELQRLGGWKTQSMVERYAHVAPERLQFAASRLDSFMQPHGVSEVIYQHEGRRI
ncbi:MAG: site-specific integrase [Rhodoferax sp.]